MKLESPRGLRKCSINSEFPNHDTYHLVTILCKKVLKTINEPTCSIQNSMPLRKTILMFHITI